MEDGHEYKHMKAYIRDGRYQFFMDAKGYRSLLSGPLEAELQDGSDGHSLNKKVTLKLNRKAIISKANFIPPGSYSDEIKEIRVIITKEDYEALWDFQSLSIRDGPGFDISIEYNLYGMV